jgi:hypothetical protein
MNDLRNWSPTAPVLLCAGDQDPTVFYLEHSVDAAVLDGECTWRFRDGAGCGLKL